MVRPKRRLDVPDNLAVESQRARAPAFGHTAAAVPFRVGNAPDKESGQIGCRVIGYPDGENRTMPNSAKARLAHRRPRRNSCTRLGTARPTYMASAANS